MVCLWTLKAPPPPYPSKRLFLVSEKSSKCYGFTRTKSWGKGGKDSIGLNRLFARGGLLGIDLTWKRRWTRMSCCSFFLLIAW